MQCCVIDCHLSFSNEVLHVNLLGFDNYYFSRYNIVLSRRTRCYIGLNIQSATP